MIIERSDGFYKIGKVLRNFKIRNRLIVSFIILSFVPLLITGILAYYKSSSAIKSKINTYSMQVMNQVGNNIQLQLDKIVADNEEIIYSDSIQNNLGNYSNMETEDKSTFATSLDNVFINKYKTISAVRYSAIITSDFENSFLYGAQASPYKNSSILETIKKEKVPTTFEFKNDLVAYSQFKNNNWKIVSLIPLSYLYAESKSLGYFIVVFSIICLALAILLSLIISSSIYVPLKNVVKLMSIATKYFLKTVLV